MESAIGNQRISVRDSLFQSPRRFSFEMAAYILNNNAKISYGKEISVASASFRTMNVIALHLRATEIEKIRDDEQPVLFSNRLAIAGLNAPLPPPFATRALRRAHEQDFAMTEFLNVFHSRLLGVSYRISQRKYLTLQEKGRWKVLNCVAALCGNKKMSKNHVRIAYLLWAKERSAEGLRILIAGYFHLKVKIHQLCDHMAPRQDIVPLGINRLSENAYLGTHVSIKSFGIKISMTHDDPNVIFDFISKGNAFNELKLMVRKYIGPMMICELEFYPPLTPMLKICSRLGENSWFGGRNCDPIKIMI